jgi:hypothetical protein
MHYRRGGIANVPARRSLRTFRLAATLVELFEVSQDDLTISRWQQEPRERAGNGRTDR